MNRFLWMLAVAMISAGPLYAAGESAGEDGEKDSPTKLGRRYVDALRGYSLQPPAGTDRRRESGASMVTTWVKWDEKANAIRWTLTAQTVKEEKGNIEIKPYSEALAKKLKDGGFDIDSSDLDKVAGVDCMHFSGLTSVKLYQHQAWILPRRGEFLILAVTGPADMKATLDAILAEVLKTVRLEDPEKAKAQSEANILRAAELLAGLKDRQIASAVSPDPLWFILQLDGRDIGFIAQTEAAVRRDNADGFEVQTWVMTQLPKDKPRMLRRRMFATADRFFEHWEEKLEVGVGNEMTTLREEGLKQGNVIAATVWGNGPPRTVNKKVPDVLQKFFLPQMTGSILGSLLDLSKPTSYAFATYNSQTNDFEMRTFTVSEPAAITVSGARVAATKASDQAAADVEAAAVFLDAKGKTLRMTSGEGLMMERSTRDAVTQPFPKAEDVAKEFLIPWRLEPQPIRAPRPPRKP